MTSPPSPPEQQPAPQDPPRKESGFDLYTSRLIRLVGLGIAVYETIAEKADRPTLLGAALVMMTGSLAYDAIKRKTLS